MNIHIQFANGQQLKAPIIAPPPKLSPSRHLFQSTTLGTRIKVLIENDEKAVCGWVLRADIAANGLSLALLETGVLLGWTDDGAWGVQRMPSTEPYNDPNWNFPYAPGSPIPNGSVVPAFPSATTVSTESSWELAYVAEDAVVEAARASTDEWLTKSALPLRRLERKEMDVAVGPWLFLPLVGSYEERGGEWQGWIEDEARTWIAFIGHDGAGVVWKERGVGGEVLGHPTVFFREVATFPLAPAPRRRGGIKKIRSHRGIEIHIDRPMGTVIEGVGPDGVSYVFEQRCDYGFFPSTLGDDLDEFDVYMGPNPLAANVYIIEQMRAKSGWWDERKAIVGCDSAEDALALYKAHVHPRMVGRIGTMTHEAFESALRAHQKTYAETKKNARTPFIPVTLEDAAELSDMEALRAALETTWLMLDDAKSGTPHDLMAAKAEADDITNFPNKGDNKTVSLRNSKFERFDIDWAADLKKNHPKVWALVTNNIDNRQFGIVSRIQRQGGAPHTAAEEAAIRLRESWAARHFEESRVPGVVAQAQWVLVGKLGESRMKEILNKEKERRSDKGAELADRAPLSFPPPSDDFNPPDNEPSSIPPISAPPPSSASNPMTANAQLSTTDPMMVLPPMPPAKDAGTDESELEGKDAGPLSTRTPNIQPQTPSKAMANATQDRLHHLVHRIVTATLALSAIGAITIPTDERESFRRYLAGTGTDVAGVPQHKDANPSGVSGRGGQTSDGVMRRNVMELRAAESIANVDVENREITFIASTWSVDSHGEVVAQDWIFDRFEKNPVILWAHNQREPPIGRAVKWWVDGGKTLYIRVRFSQVYAFAQLIFDMIVEETIRACSVGFIPHEITRQEIDGQMRTVLRRNELCELSVCPVPSNADAVVPKEFENMLAERYERCAAELERRIAAFDTKNSSSGNNHNAAPVNGEGVGGQSTRQRAPATAPANPSAATTSGGPSRGKTPMTHIDQKYAKEQVRREGSLVHRCQGCGTDAQIQLSGVREHMIELEGQRDSFEQKYSLSLTKIKEEEDKRKAAERERDDLRVKQTETELVGLVGPDAWNITPVEARQLAELRVRSGEEAYQNQLTSRKEHCGKVKALADELVRVKNAPAVPPPPVAGQAPTTVMSGLNGATPVPPPAQPTIKTNDPTVGWLAS